MTIWLPDIPASVTLPLFFPSYGASGESITLTGLATTDIEIYKGTSTTQRASDNGYALVDTDGIDIDTRTGIHGFSIDLSDNSDAGFYAAGSFYHVVVDAVTINTQTVRFIFAFRIVAAESTAGTPRADVTHWLGTAAATPTVAGVPEVDLTHIGGDAQSGTDLKDFADAGYDPSTNKVQGVVLVDTLTTYTGNTVQTGDSFARLGAPAGASVSADILAVDNLVDDLESRLGTPSNLGSGATVAANLVDIEGQTDDIGAAGAGLTAITNLLPAIIRENTAQGGSFTSITLDAGASSQTDQYAGNWVVLTGGTGSGQTAQITAYNGTSKVASVYTWAVAPDSTTTFRILQTPIPSVNVFVVSSSAGSSIGNSVWSTAARTLTAATNITSTGGTTVPQTGDSFARIGAAGASLTDLGGMSTTMKGQVNAEMLDVLNTDTFAQPGQEAPAATTTLVKMLSYLYKAFRNKKTQTATERKLYADDGTTVDQKATDSDDSTTYTKGELGAGP